MLQSKYTQGSLTPGIKHATWGNNASAGSRSLLDPVGAAGKAPLPGPAPCAWEQPSSEHHRHCSPFGLPVFGLHASFLNDHGQAEDQPDSNCPADEAQGYDKGVCVPRGWSRRGG